MPEDMLTKSNNKISLINTTKDNDQMSALPEFLLGDERRLKQVLINLVKNAKKFTDSGGIEIKVSYSIEKQSLVMHVVDTGTGIAKQDLPKLFNKFGKLERTAEQNSEGIGLGLTIVKAIVKKAGGKVVALSDGPGRGSTFCFSMITPVFESDLMKSSIA